MNPRTMILAVIALTTAIHAQVKTWTDVQGRTMEAKFVRLEGDSVYFLKNGRTITFPLKQLSKKDRKTIDQIVNPESPYKGVPTSGKHYLTKEKLIYPHNFDAPFPKNISAGDFEVIIVKEDKEASEFIYESDHFQFHSNVRLKKTVVKEFAKTFEATFNYHMALPFGFPYPESDSGLSKYKTRLFDTKEAYVYAGAPESSAGVYFGRTDTIMIPLSSLGVKAGSTGCYLDRSKSSSVLVHEIAHQLSLNRGLHRPPNWWVEGFADYVDYTPFSVSSFKISRKEKAMTEQVQRRFEYALEYGGGRFPNFKEYFQTRYWDKDADGYHSSIYYGLGALLVYYFCHEDGDGNGQAMRDYIVDLRKGVPYLKAEASLLRGRSYDEFKKEFTSHWKRRGIDIEFVEE